MGNRDINKMRLTAELSDYAMNRTPSEAFKPWWDNKAMDLVKYLRKDNKEDSRVNRLKWMLRHTLGSPAAFDFRRKELANFSRGLEISDEEVLESFLESVLQPEGAVQSYLRHAQLGLVIGDTLFVHGAAEERALGFVPSHQTRYVKNKREDLLKLPGRQSMPPALGGLDLRQWIDALNRFAVRSSTNWLPLLKTGGPWWLLLPTCPNEPAGSCSASHAAAVPHSPSRWWCPATWMGRTCRPGRPLIRMYLKDNASAPTP
ncbi:Hypothetical protein SCF082_LOCUS19221 [Durusdinium trenchii]|uniref:Uncharacterized protein n=1 Tax=Durusdinium trenchii TaxID=1381693 RepID=A0ABP0KUF1_9DINO